MIDPAVNQNLNFCSLSEKAGVTLLYMYRIVEEEKFKVLKIIVQYHTDVIQPGLAEQSGCTH